MNETKYPIRRDLDGCFFRVQRDGKWHSLCFSDLTEEERLEVTKGKDLYWHQRMLEYMTKQLRQVGDHFDIMAREE